MGFGAYLASFLLAAMAFPRQYNSQEVKIFYLRLAQLNYTSTPTQASRPWIS